MSFVDPAPPPARVRALEVLWIEPKAAARLRKHAPFRELLGTLEDEDKKPSPVLPNQKVAVEDRRDVAVLLTQAAATPGSEVRNVVARATRPDGKFTPPLLLLEGQLSLSFDRAELLKATVANAAPFSSGDEALKAAIDAASELLGLPSLVAASGALEVQTARIREAFARGKRAVPPQFVETEVERALIEQRSYEQRPFQGAPHLRADLRTEGLPKPFATYLPKPVAEALPLTLVFPVRILVEALRSADPRDGHPFALKALALGRLLPGPMIEDEGR